MYHENMVKIAKRIVTGQCRMVWLGDSLSSEANEPRWMESLIKTFDIEWQGRVILGSTFSASANGVRTISLGTTVDPLDTMADGQPCPWPWQTYQNTESSNIGPGSGLRRLEATNLADYVRGPWTQGEAVTGRVIYYDDATGIGTRVNFRQNASTDNVTVNDTGATIPLAQDSAIKILDLVVDPHPGGTDTSWDIEHEGSTAIDETTGPKTICGALIFTPNKTTGLQMGVIAQGGWDHHDHRSGDAGDDSYHAEGQYTDAQIRNYCRYTRSPDTVCIHVVNGASSESGSGSELVAQFKANLVHIITRWRTQMLLAAADNGDTIDPMFFLLSPWTTISTATRDERDALHDAALELQDERSDVGTMYMNTMMDEKYGPWSTWAPNFLDGGLIHQVADGIIPFGETLWDEIYAASLQEEGEAAIVVTNVPARFLQGRPQMIEYTPGSAIVAGQVVVLSGQCYVAHRAAAAGDLASVASPAKGGLYVIRKADGLSYARGDEVLFDATEQEATAGGAGFFGYAHEPASASANFVTARLSRKSG